MKILVLGGTQFIGRNLVERLLQHQEHEVTLFNRQRTQADLFPRVQKIKGDRESKDVLQLQKHQWDAVIDLSCFYPESLKQVLQAVGPVEKYILISTCSVYDNENNQSELRDESADILSCSQEEALDRSATTYGKRKAACERLLQNAGIPHAILRPALVFGQYDLTDRFYYWLYQTQFNNPLLVPENGKRKFSTTYVMDLVEAIIRCLSDEVENEVFNITTNPSTQIQQIIELAKSRLHKNPNTVNATVEFLNAHSIAQWTDMPLWISGDHFTYSNRKMKEMLDLTPTDFEKATGETITYFEKLNWPLPQYGISEQQRLALLEGLV